VFLNCSADETLQKCVFRHVKFQKAKNWKIICDLGAIKNMLSLSLTASLPYLWCV